MSLNFESANPHILGNTSYANFYPLIHDSIPKTKMISSDGVSFRS